MKEDMTIQVHCHAGCGNNLGLWAYEVEYAKEHGNSLNDICNSDHGEEKNTTIVQMQFASILKAFLYLNSLTGSFEPDTRNVLLHIPSDDIRKWLEKEFGIVNYPTKRDKVSRLYTDYCNDIWLETNGWNITYKVIDDALPEWLLIRLKWL